MCLFALPLAIDYSLCSYVFVCVFSLFVRAVFTCVCGDGFCFGSFEQSFVPYIILFAYVFSHTCNKS